MGLYERWTANAESGGAKIAVHAFGAALAEYARGAVTAQQIIAAFALSGDELTELAAIKAKYDGLPDSAKAAAMGKFQDVMLLVEAGFYDKTKAKTELGF